MSDFVTQDARMTIPLRWPQVDPNHHSRSSADVSSKDTGSELSKLPFISLCPSVDYSVISPLHFCHSRFLDFLSVSTHSSASFASSHSYFSDVRTINFSSPTRNSLKNSSLSLFAPLSTSRTLSHSILPVHTSKAFNRSFYTLSEKRFIRVQCPIDGRTACQYHSGWADYRQCCHSHVRLGHHRCSHVLPKIGSTSGPHCALARRQHVRYSVHRLRSHTRHLLLDPLRARPSERVVRSAIVSHQSLSLPRQRMRLLLLVPSSSRLPTFPHRLPHEGSSTVVQRVHLQHRSAVAHELSTSLSSSSAWILRISS